MHPSNVVTHLALVAFEGRLLCAPLFAAAVKLDARALQRVPSSACCCRSLGALAAACGQLCAAPLLGFDVPAGQVPARHGGAIQSYARSQWMRRRNAAAQAACG